MSYNTNLEADSYFAAKFGFDKWESLTELSKSKALFSANQMLDLLCDWDGYKTDEEQDNEFPRNQEVVVPDAVKYAECEMAYLIIDAGNVSTDSGDSLTELTAGPVTMKFNATAKAGNPLVNDLTKSLLKPLGTCSFNLGGGSTTLISSYRG